MSTSEKTIDTLFSARMLTEARAMLRIIALATMADGKKAPEEELAGRFLATGIPALSSYTPEALSALLTEAFTALAREGREASLKHALDSLQTPDLRAQAFAIAVAVCIADRTLDPEEEALLEVLREAAGLSKEAAFQFRERIAALMRQKASAATPEEAKRPEGRPEALLTSAEAALAAGDLEQARRDFEAALSLFEQESHPESPALLRPLTGLAEVHLRRADHAARTNTLRRMMLIESKQHGADSLPVAAVQAALAESLEAQGQLEIAERIYKSALAIRFKHQGAKHLDTAAAARAVGAVLKRQGKHADALPLLAHSLKVREEALGESDPALLEELDGLAEVLSALGDNEGASQILSRSQKILEQKLAALPNAPQGAPKLSAEALLMREFSALMARDERDPAEEARLSRTLGMLHLTQNRPEEAEPLLARALELTRQRVGPAHIDLAPHLEALAMAQQQTGRLWEARKSFQEILALREQALGTEHSELLWTTRVQLIQLLITLGERAEAIALAEKLLSTENPLTGMIAGLLLTGLYTQAGEYEAAYRVTTRTKEFIKQMSVLLEGEGNDLDLWVIPLLEANILRRLGRFAEAAELLERVRATIEQIPEQAAVATSLLPFLALLYRRLGREEEAHVLYEKLVAQLGDGVRIPGADPKKAEEARVKLAAQEKAQGPDSSAVAWTLLELASHESALGRLQEAAALYRRALRIFEASLGPRSTEVADTLEGLASTLRLLGRPEEAEPLEERALAIPLAARPTPTEAQCAAWQAHIDAGNAALKRGDYQEAARHLEPTLTLAEGWGISYQKQAFALNQLARVRAHRGEPSAETLYRKAIALGEKAFGPGSVDVAIYRMNLAFFLKGQGRLVEAAPLYRRAAQRLAHGNEQERSFAVSSWRGLAEMLSEQNQHAEARGVLEEALAILRGLSEPDREILAATCEDLGALLLAEKAPDRALPLLEEAILLREGGEASLLQKAEMLRLSALQELGRFEALLPHLERLVARLSAPVSPLLYQFLMGLALIAGPGLVLEGKLAEAERLLRLVLRPDARNQEERLTRTPVELQLVALLLAQGKDAEAEETLTPLAAFLWGEEQDVIAAVLTTLENQRTEVLRARFGEEGVARWRAHLAAVYHRAGRQLPSMEDPIARMIQEFLSIADELIAYGALDKAEEALKQAIELQGKLLPPSDPGHQRPRQAYAALLRRMGRVREAEALDSLS